MPIAAAKKSAAWAVREQREDVETKVCVAAICALASLPLVLSVALVTWGA